MRWRYVFSCSIPYIMLKRGKSVINMMEAFQLLPAPRTNGVLLIAVAENELTVVQELLSGRGYHNFIEPIGRMTERGEKVVKSNDILLYMRAGDVDDGFLFLALSFWQKSLFIVSFQEYSRKMTIG